MHVYGEISGTLTASGELTGELNTSGHLDGTLSRAVRTTGDYEELTNKPSINEVELIGDKTSADLGLADAVHTHTVSQITDFPTLSTVATSGDYNDLTNKPTIPTLNLFIINVGYDPDEDEYYLTDTTFEDICEAYDEGMALILIYTDEDGYGSEYTLLDYAEDDGYILFVSTFTATVVKKFTVLDDDTVTYDEGQAKTSDLINDSLFAKGKSAIWGGTCTTAGGTTTKYVSCTGFLSTDLIAGVMVVVTFSNTNTAPVSALKLDVQGRGEKPIKVYKAGEVTNLEGASYLTGTMPFIYDGTNWVTWYDTPDTDTKVYQQYQASSGYSYWRPLVIGKSSSGTEGFNPSSVTDQTYVFNTLEVQPSTGLIRMGGASFYSGSYTTKMTPTTLTENRTITVPNKSGTMAMLEDVPTKVSDLNNDSGFITLADLPIYDGSVV